MVVRGDVLRGRRARVHRDDAIVFACGFINGGAEEKIWGEEAE